MFVLEHCLELYGEDLSSESGWESGEDEAHETDARRDYAKHATKKFVVHSSTSLRMPRCTPVCCQTIDRLEWKSHHGTRGQKLDPLHFQRLQHAVTTAMPQANTG